MVCYWCCVAPWSWLLLVWVELPRLWSDHNNCASRAIVMPTAQPASVGPANRSDAFLMGLSSGCVCVCLFSQGNTESQAQSLVRSWFCFEQGVSEPGLPCVYTHTQAHVHAQTHTPSTH